MNLSDNPLAQLRQSIDLEANDYDMDPEPYVPLQLEQALVSVEKGVAWLDEKRPDWLSHLDLESLALDDSRHCVLGQLAYAVVGDSSSHYASIVECDDSRDGGVSTDPCILAWMNMTEGLSQDDARAMGFDECVDNQTSYHLLDHAWGVMIRRRQAEVGSG